MVYKIDTSALLSGIIEVEAESLEDACRQAGQKAIVDANYAVKLLDGNDRLNTNTISHYSPLLMREVEVAEDGNLTLVELLLQDYTKKEIEKLFSELIEKYNLNV